MRPKSFSAYLKAVISVDGRIWTISDEKGFVGYAYVAPIPGLEAVLDLQGCIDPDRQRQGFGSQLLNNILASLKKSGSCQLSHPVYTLTSPAALFLQSHQFFVEHIECQMLLENPDRSPATSLPPNFRLATFPVGTAVRTFRRLYGTIFKNHPWYQPYTNTREVMAELTGSTDLLFLLDGNETAGFAWLRMPEPDLGEIEPFGLLPNYQGQGIGAAFLKAAIQQLVTRGAEHIRIGAWQRNERAIRLYQQIGFKHTTTLTYLAYNVS